MNKKLTISILILMISSCIVYGQQITFQKNINHSASDLKQELNKNGDSLMLACSSSKIYQVDIFNENFSERIKVSGKSTKIDLTTLPYGNFIVQAKVDQKLIIMFLQKKNEDTFDSSDLSDFYNNNYVSIRSSNHIKKNEKPVYYWVVSESNSNFGSIKSMKLEYKEEVVKLISKHKLELKSTTGKHNKLYIYAIYDKSNFMNMQFRNPNYYKSTEHSKFFNTEPFYVSKGMTQGTSAP